ncbi:cell wall hydrolase [Pseudohongiella spirulinae]|uniref:Hydrolase n=1 Tax=Pseudohongiella spirulinae TaxID=1249552 RepID=A0A0S2KE56_9GAMM|nr:cell wall hydrolase [Pseudohongiella spirulinae]ALO46584.1 hydrolase [Pseudohongiella spirulinae]
MRPSDADILIGALTIHGEARGCTQPGRTAIAHCIINRAKARKWWGKGTAGYADHTIAAVCLKPWQFSCWNPNDPNQILLKTLQEQYRAAIQKPTCRAALKALIDALDGYEPDQTGGATHYLTTNLHKSARCPAWAKGNNNFVEIGSHRFFSGIA